MNRRSLSGNSGETVPRRGQNIRGAPAKRSSRNSLDNREFTSPAAPSLHPGLGTTDGENHQLLIHQVVPIIVCTREVPAAQDRVDVRLEAGWELADYGDSALNSQAN